MERITNRGLAAEIGVAPMANVPTEPKIDQIVWFENHVPLWVLTPAPLLQTEKSLEMF